MSALILHLSDIHISAASDPVLARGRSIAATLFKRLQSASTVVVVLSGDIAQAGRSEEYALANQFVEELKSAIHAERQDVEISFVIAPGNHDCDFSQEDPVRSLTLNDIASKAPTVPDRYIEVAVSPQENFFRFRDQLASHLPTITSDPLWVTYPLDIAGKRVHFDVLNASWMSSKNEKPGNLLFPFERYEALKPDDADLRIGVLHHPFGWYNQKNQLRFRSFMHRLCDLILSGHEHYSSGRLADDARDGECAYIEGSCLFERATSHSAFNVIEVDLENAQFSYEEFKWQGGAYVGVRTTAWSDYRPMPKRAPHELTFQDTFRKQLSDPGATLRHPSGRDLALEDIYVYPDLDTRDTVKDDRSGSLSSQKTSARVLEGLPERAESVLLEGDDHAGKTKLLHHLAGTYHAKGYLPLLLSGVRLKSATKASLEGIVRSAVGVQYGSEAREKFEQTSKSRKILLLDDLDRSSLNGDSRGKLLDWLRDRFHVLVVTVGEDFEFTELLGSDEVSSLTTFKRFRISPLGYQRRGDLIRKWFAFGATEETTPNELLQMEDEASHLIESARLKHVASTSPIFVLSLLQGTASGLSKDLHNSSFASYYHFLIVGALERGKVSPQDMPTYIAACTHLSWFVRVHGVDQRITEVQFKQFVREYSEEWTAMDPGGLRRVLVDSRLIVEDADALAFTYPYAYYYFLGKFASISLEKAEVKEYLDYCMRHLYVRECANTLLFLAHHTGTSVVLDHLVNGLQKHFTRTDPATFSKQDVAKVAALISQAPKLEYENTRPKEYRNERDKWRDDTDNGHDGLKDKPADISTGMNLMDEIISLTKSMEIAGALLSHQFPNYTRATKNGAIKSIFDAAMRAVRDLFALFDADPDELIRSTVNRLGSKRNSIPREQLEQQVRLAIGWLLRSLSTGFVVRAGSSLTADELSDNIENVVASNPTSANRLIRVSQLLAKPTRLPRAHVNTLVREEGDNVCVMSILQTLVLHRMYMYETDFDDKDWAISVFKLSAQSPALELRHRKRPSLGR